MRQRIQCKYLKKFGGVENPCHKILCEIVADEVTEEDGDYVVKGFRELKLKCSDANCKRITTIRRKKNERK